ncbi:uncharacterized protein LOC128267006 [Anopheles cruzii]|uniref:uncharacterized protein LOC128267006 n=1 Tax=Anopheles cruzii TaxID=68878 RepID=UPI0022EC28DB|nr:uncharacterized protein LOC128267006 [Anopheles cruzii]
MASLRGRWMVCCLLLTLASATAQRKFIKNRFASAYEPFAGTWNDQFDWDLIKEVLQKSPGNALLSPISIKAMLALLYEGSGTLSETQRDLYRTLSGENPQAISKLSDDLLRYKSQQGSGLLIADRVYHDNSIEVKQKFLSIIGAHYNATTEAVNFGDAISAASQINRWIAQNTGGLIEDVVRSDALRDTLLLLINTIYFKGTWSVPFQLNATAERPFYTSGRQGTGKATFMKQRDHVFHYRRSEQLGAQFLRLPYHSSHLSMIVILPDEQVTLGQLLQRLTAASVHQELARLEEEEIEVELPKFTIRYASPLRECLENLGLGRVFTDQAELTLISRGNATPLKVSTILQKSCILVDEQGTEAAAATEGSLVFTILNEPTKFIANRPFLFTIYDESNGNWLFAGKVEDPASQSICFPVRVFSAMLKLSFAILCYSALLLLDTNAQQYPRGPYQAKRDVQFDLQFLKEVFRPQTTNVIVSPFSVKILLTLIYEASDTNFGDSSSATRRELGVVIRNDVPQTRSFYKELLASAQRQNKDFDLNIATNFFVDDFIEVINKYVQIAKEHYDASVEKVSYSNPSEAAGTINNWVSKSTHGRLTEIVSPDALEGAVITLINVIYFKGLWSYPFPETPNNVQPFYRSQGKPTSVHYMEQNGQFYYDHSDALKAQLLRLPYRGDKLAMFFILPDQDSSVSEVLDRMTNESLHLALWYMDEREVNVTIPKFKIDFSEQLNEPLQNMGIREIFSQRASLPLLARGVGARNEVRVSRIFQKAGITINELGSEAYAATEIQLVNKFGGDGVHIFNANRPFMFFIEDETQGTMLFAGKIEDPQV